MRYGAEAGVFNAEWAGMVQKLVFVMLREEVWC